MLPYIPIVTPRVEAVERSANTTPIATNAAAMNGVPSASTIAGPTNPFRCPKTTITADQPTAPANTTGHRWCRRSTRRPAGTRETPFTIACSASR